MLFDTDRTSLRQLFFDSWHKHQTQQPLSALETQLVNIILQHPEYHDLLNHPEENLQRDFLATREEPNPFLHLALHQAIYEQISTDRPTGITDVYQQLIKKYGDIHVVEHRIIDVLVEQIVAAQQNITAAGDIEKIYLERLKELL